MWRADIVVWLAAAAAMAAAMAAACPSARPRRGERESGCAHAAAANDDGAAGIAAAAQIHPDAAAAHEKGLRQYKRFRARLYKWRDGRGRHRRHCRGARPRWVPWPLNRRALDAVGEGQAWRGKRRRESQRQGKKSI